MSDLLRETFTRAAAGQGLTFAEGRALRLVGLDATQQQLTEILGVDKSRVSTILGRLETRGLVARRTGDGDRRVRHVELTEDGTAAVAGIGAHLEAHSPLIRHLDQEERELYYGLLRKIVDRR